MAFGPGKYDAEATFVHSMTGGEVVVLVVVNGNRGSGMSVKTIAGGTLAAIELQAKVMRDVLVELERMAASLRAH
jgi:hypothetical protein